MPVHGRRFRQPIGHVDPHAIAFAEAQRRPRYLAVEGVGVDENRGQDLPADDGRLQVEDLDAVFDARCEHLRSVLVQTVTGGDVARIHRGHVQHRGGRRFLRHDHARRHDRSANLLGRQPQIEESRGQGHAGDQHEQREYSDCDQLRASHIGLHLMTAARLGTAHRLTFMFGGGLRFRHCVIALMIALAAMTSPCSPLHPPACLDDACSA